MKAYSFVPYGPTVDEDQPRLAYFLALRRYIAERVRAAIDATWPDPAAAPPHIQKVPLMLLLQSTCMHACTDGLTWASCFRA